MPSCVEVALLRLKKPSSTAEVEQNDTHKKALDIVTSQSHNLGCTWGVLSEDPTLLVWLVGELRCTYPVSTVIRSSRRRPTRYPHETYCIATDSSVLRDKNISSVSEIPVSTLRLTTSRPKENIAWPVSTYTDYFLPLCYRINCPPTPLPFYCTYIVRRLGRNGRSYKTLYGISQLSTFPQSPHKPSRRQSNSLHDALHIPNSAIRTSFSFTSDTSNLTNQHIIR